MTNTEICLLQYLPRHQLQAHKSSLKKNEFGAFRLLLILREPVPRLGAAMQNRRCVPSARSHSSFRNSARVSQVEGYWTKSLRC